MLERKYFVFLNATKKTCIEHYAIIAALDKRESDIVERAMSEHIQKAGEELLTSLQEGKL